SHCTHSMTHHLLNHRLLLFSHFPTFFFFFFFYCSAHHRDLHSFPTRRSSDLIKRRICQCIADEDVRSITELQAKLLHEPAAMERDRKSTRLNSSHLVISYAVFCLKKKKK